MDQADPPKRGRGRPRTPGAEEKILHAALEEYGEHGWAGFTMDGVARRAEVGKSTVYLRWADKDVLLTDAVRHSSSAIVPVDSGSMRGDLVQLTRNVFAAFADPEGWANFRAVIDTVSASHSLGEFTRYISGVHREIIDALFARARARGETFRAIEPPAVTDLLYGAALFYVIGCRLRGEEISEDAMEARVSDVVDTVLHGLTTD